jgi:hypothetical protein
MGELFNFSDTSWLTSTDGQHKLLFDLTNNRLDLQDVGDIRCLTGATPTERLRITAAGNVGIGKQPAPSYRLDVNGSLNATDILKNGTSLVSSQWTGVSGGIAYTAGNVGIGTAQISRRLHVEPSEIHSGGGGAGFSFSNRETGAFVEQPGGGERWVWYAAGGNARLWSAGDKLVVTPGGNVGIGTLPGAKLDVNGGIKSKGQFVIKDIRVEIVDVGRGEGDVGGGWYRLAGDLNMGAGGKFIYLQILRAFD